MGTVWLRLTRLRADRGDMKLSLRRLRDKLSNEDKTLNPDMRKLLNSYEPLHPERSEIAEDVSEERVEDSAATAA
jgi:hypothetical protein